MTPPPHSPIGTSATYSMEDMQGCKRGGHRIKSYARAHFVHPGYIHTVRLRGLTSGARYWYRYGSPALADGWSAVHSFAAPARERRPFSFVAFGDLGTATWPDMRRFPEYWDCPAAQATADRLAAQLQEDRAPPFDFVLHLGDISYAVGFAPRWEQFHHLVAPVASHVPYLVVDGNHDVGDDSFGECGVPFFARFHFPNHPQVSTAPCRSTQVAGDGRMSAVCHRLPHIPSGPGKPGMLESRGMGLQGGGTTALDSGSDFVFRSYKKFTGSAVTGGAPSISRCSAWWCTRVWCTVEGAPTGT